MTEISELYDFPMGYRGLVLNNHRNTDGTLKVGPDEADNIRVSAFDYSRLQLRDQREAFHLVSGGDLGVGTEAFRYLSLAGMLRGTTPGKLEDRIAAFLQAFDIEEAQIDAPTTEGCSPLDFYCPTEIVGYAPVQHEQFLCRPAAYPIVPERRSQGLQSSFATELVCADPRRYRVDATTKTLDGSNGFSQVCPNWTVLVGKATPPLVTITMSAAGATNFTLSNGVTSLVLNLSSLAAGNVVTIDMARATIKVGALYRADLRTSAVDTFFSIPRGGATVVATNTAGVTSVGLAYHEARG